MGEKFGQRLKVARKMAGMSQQALADATDNRVTKQAISKYEKGQMEPDSGNLLALANALGVGSGYFFRKSGINLSGIEFRKKSKLGQKEINRIECQTLDFLERYIEIEEIVGQRIIFNNPLKDFRIRSYKDVDAAAEKLRDEWDLGESPISNLMELLEDRGICVYEIEASDSFDGLSGFVGDIPVIILNQAFNLVRKRFTLAHELGHILLKFPKHEAFEPKLKEKMCHAFAGAFLLPYSAISSELFGKRQNIVEWELKKLKGVYGISMAAIMARAHNLGLISDNRYKRFCIHVNTMGWRQNEPGEYVGKERANRFKQLIFYAVAEDIVTMSKGAELLNVKLPQFRRKFQLVA